MPLRAMFRLVPTIPEPQSAPAVTTAPRTWHCAACDVRWHGLDNRCWICDRKGVAAYA